MVAGVLCVCRKGNGGRGGHTRIFTANTRRNAQFSSGVENLIHQTDAASIFRNNFLLRQLIRIVWADDYAEQPLDSPLRMAVAVRRDNGLSGMGGEWQSFGFAIHCRFQKHQRRLAAKLGDFRDPNP